jgi:hypothetical protein
VRVVVPSIDSQRVDYTDLKNRCRARWAKRRTDIEREIQGRTRINPQSNNREALHGWE